MTIDVRSDTTHRFSNGGANVTEYVPGRTYFATVTVSAPMGNPAGYGFQAVFLDDPASGIPQGVGNAVIPMTEDSARIGMNAGRQYIEHRFRTPSGSWNFEWTAPAAGTGDVKLYSVGNAVNGANGSGGDSGSSMSTVITLTEQTLPVELAAFNATVHKQEVKLDWTSATEENVSHFELERSANGINFQRIASLP
ncbi:MAG: choice-of-anchor V domain-containing protein, partial [Cyanobacteria bacterium P01_D01_bin.50]